MLIYCHGLGSSGKSDKANILRRECSDLGVLAPDLPLEPREAIARIEAELNQANGTRHLLIGSSLGGFYALYLHQQKGVPAVLLNPAIAPFQEQSNREAIQRHIDKPLAWRADYMPQLAAMQIKPEDVKPQDLRIYLAQDDDLLDYKVALNFFGVTKCAITVLPNGGHRLSNFETIIPEIRAFYLSLK
jgi:predicted esterase YcpF (UPF0227 family)